MDSKQFVEEVDWIFEQFDKSNKQEYDHALFEERLANLTLHYKTEHSYNWRNLK